MSIEADLFGETSLRRVVSEYLGHYHEERNHQGKQNLLLSPYLLRVSRVRSVRYAAESGSAGYSNITGAPPECLDHAIFDLRDYGVIRRYKIVHYGAGAATAACEMDRPRVLPELSFGGSA